MPGEGDDITIGDTFGGIESTKSVSDLYAPISGEIIEINEALLESPEIINEDPYGSGWIVRVKPYDTSELDSLLNSEGYSDFVENQDEE